MMPHARRASASQFRRTLVPFLLALVLATTALGQVPAGDIVPDLNINRDASANRLPSATQQQAWSQFQKDNSRASIRWDKFAGSVDALMDFRSSALTGAAASAALEFVRSNGAIFGVSDVSTLQLRTARNALGGHLVRFDQTYQGMRVQGGGIGVVLDKDQRAIAAFGPYYAVTGVGTSPGISGADAVARAQADLAPLAVDVPAEALDVAAPALDKLESSLGEFREPSPVLTVFPTADGFRLAWDFLLYSRNPFGVFRYSVDANSGEVLSRQNQVRFLQDPVQATGDIFPTHPTITQQLQDQGIISKDGSGRPLGQLRVNLRNFDATNRTTGAAGELTGTHALVHNVLAVKAPFAQAALNTWHFAQDAVPLEQTTREDVHFGPEAEPAEHQDEVNIFFFINYLLEYITHLHIGDDAAGNFPDEFPNKDLPLTGVVHIPQLPGLTCTIGGGAACPAPGDPEFAQKFLGLDNAFSLPLSDTVNPTAYGHGFLFNDLAIEDGVPYHEGMHSISTPIAGFEGDAEAGGLNEGQADLWAQTITQDPSLGEYVVNGHRLRQEVREGKRFLATKGDPDLIGWIRNANSGLLYSQLCRFNSSSRAPDGRECEEHQDGEIYAAVMWDLREMLLLAFSGAGSNRPELETGAPTTSIALGQKKWEELFLGSIYVLGLTEPDTFVRARDAVIIADGMMFPSAADPAIGAHRTHIEHVFAAREIGVNAGPPVNAGRQVVSSAVSAYTDAQPSLRRPGGVKATVFGDGVQVSWKGVSGALAYEVVKRRKGAKSGRLYPSDLKTHAYAEGDTVTDGFGHVEYVPASQTAMVDRGQIVGFLRPRGLEDPKGFTYGVRTVNINADGTMGVSETEFVDATAPETFIVDTEIFTGAVPIGSAGNNLVNGVDYVDVPFTGKAGTVGVNATLSADVSVLVVPDVDFVLFEVADDGRLVQIGSSGNFGPDEFISAQIIPGGNYVYRVVGFANAATTFRIESKQFLLPPTL